MFVKSLADVFQVCFSIVSFSAFVDILMNRLDFYLSRKITEFQDRALEITIYKPLVQRFSKYVSLIDAILNILVANFIGLLSPQYLHFVFWIGTIVLITDVVILLPKYRELVSKIKYIKLRSKERNIK